MWKEKIDSIATLCFEPAVKPHTNTIRRPDQEDELNQPFNE